MHRIIFYDPTLLVVSEEGVADATLDDIRATARFVSSESKDGALLRDASAFSGNLERVAGELPAAVLFLISERAPDHITAAFDRIDEAFSEVEVPVEEISIHASGNPSEDEDDAADNAAIRLASLKARATELGVNFAPNIGEKALAARIVQEEARIADEAAAEKESDEKAAAAAAAKGGE